MGTPEGGGQSQKSGQRIVQEIYDAAVTANDDERAAFVHECWSRFLHWLLETKYADTEDSLKEWDRTQNQNRLLLKIPSPEE